MASRYAGDYFGISLTDDDSSSELLKYFPGLQKVSGPTKAQPEQTKRAVVEGAVTEGGYKVPAPFAGFKTFEKVTQPEQTKRAVVDKGAVTKSVYKVPTTFAGFKTFETLKPNR